MPNIPQHIGVWKGRNTTIGTYPTDDKWQFDDFNCTHWLRNILESVQKACLNICLFSKTRMRKRLKKDKWIDLILFYCSSMTFAGCHQLVSIDFVRTCKISALLWYWILHQFYIRTRILLQWTLVMVLINQISGLGIRLFSYLTWIFLGIQIGHGSLVVGHFNIST